MSFLRDSRDGRLDPADLAAAADPAPAPRQASPLGRAGALLACAALLAGCGGGGGGSPAPAGARPTRQFAAIADTICANANAAVSALPAPGASLGSLARSAEREVPLIDTELTQLGELTAPRRREARFLAALAATRHEVSLVTRLVAAVQAGRRPQVASLALRAQLAANQAKTEMTALGLSACAREAQPRGAS